MADVSLSGNSPSSIFNDPTVIAYNAPMTIPSNPNDPNNTSGAPTAGPPVCEPEWSPKNSEIYQRNGVSDGGCIPDGTPGGTSSPNGAIPEPSVPGAAPTATPAGTTPAGTTPSTSATLQGRDPDLIYAGDKIKLPDGSTYTVKAGDTLSGIARDHGVTLAKLMELNGFNPKLLDEYANGKLVKAHHVGDLMPAPGSATTTQTPGTAQTPQVPGTGSATGTETDPNKPNFPAKTLLEKLSEFIGPMTNKDQIKQILEKVQRHQMDPTQPELTVAEVAILQTFMTNFGNEMLQPEAKAPTAGSPIPEEPETDPKQPLAGDKGLA